MFRRVGERIVAHYLEHTDPVHKISVISRGQALGYTTSLSEKLGPRVFGHDHGQPFLGGAISGRRDHSRDAAAEIDAEIARRGACTVRPTKDAHLRACTG